MAERVRTREWPLVAGAFGLLAVHTVLDVVVAPPRGTGSLDRLTAVLVPLALLAAASVAYRRLRPGARAVLAAGLGVLALVGAGLAAADLRATFDRPSDVTGLLLAPAGAALIADAALLAWRSRKGGRRRYLRRTGIAAVLMVGCYWLVVPVALALVATHRPRAEESAPPAGYRAVTLTTRDGLDLAGWYRPSRNGAAVVAFPTRRGTASRAAMIARHGYGVLLLDMRGYDGSQGSPNAFGWGAANDLRAAVDWLARRPDVHDARIGGIGLSVGAEQLLEAAATDHRLRAVVADGAGERSVRETWLRGPSAVLALPEAAVQTVAVGIFSQSVPPPALSDVATRVAPGAVLFIQAARGAGGEDLTPTYFDSARMPKELWRVAGAGHTAGFDVAPGPYERHVIGFFDRYLTPARSR